MFIKAAAVAAITVGGLGMDQRGPGTKHRDWIAGLDSRDILVGGKADDVLRGGRGNDTLRDFRPIGHSGQDILNGRGGIDECIGDAGDIFVNCEVVRILAADDCGHEWRDGWGDHVCHLQPGHDGDHRCRCDMTDRRR